MEDDLIFSYEPIIYEEKIKLYNCSINKAHEYYEWYIKNSQDRINYICEKASKDTSIPRELFDVSPESLVLLWRWFAKITDINTENKSYLSRKDKDLIKENPVKFFKPYIKCERNVGEINPIISYILTDISMYFAAVVQGYHCTLKLKLGASWSMPNIRNYPVLTGFVLNEQQKLKCENKKLALKMNPYQMCALAARNLLFGITPSYETDLLKMYNICCRYIDEEYLIDNLEQKTKENLLRRENKKIVKRYRPKTK